MVEHMFHHHLGNSSGILSNHLQQKSKVMNGVVNGYPPEVSQLAPEELWLEDKPFLLGRKLLWPDLGRKLSLSGVVGPYL